MLHSIIKLTIQLIKRQSISPNDNGCQSILINRLKNLDFNIKQINFADTSNFLAWRGEGEGKTLAFSGHTDVVPSGNIKDWSHPPFGGSLHKNILYGRGSIDMKGAIASMITATERFIYKFPNHKGKIFFLITSDEEGIAKNGTKKIIQYLINNKKHIDYCLIGEPSSIYQIGDTIKNGRRGSLNGTIQIHGIQGHVAYPHLAKNPIHLTVPILNDLISQTWDANNKISPPTTMQITNINAGTKTNNLIPKELKIKLNIRFNNKTNENNLRFQVEEIIKKYNLNFNIFWNLSAQPYLSHNGDLVDAVSKTIKYYQKITPQISISGGTSDGRFISQMQNTEIVELGLINKTIHKINECVNVNDLYSLSMIYQRIMELLII
ncbi:succinyl-diaminopimelate desuccinylase [Blochmannia endosymbiont of Colobopsis nipponica]|uniref:succinyl-diaminopimelate desuccinylase n=1 Tax=Blochmannia endosymbiont of Colobopsis nipponica TaxID=2681987 RepID=UPI00177EA4A5|nr:succinyl-diaminopimelate desuccinylase [Blochmannia endosymbiont of Colobopsis nipponica]QOI10952.1 succinyl-diaminopimelate desuccinylase [Blochmannia endosymbiont of Colobopsis nipponica]